MLWHVHQAAVSGATFADRDRFGNDVARRLVGSMNHLCAGVLMLTIIGKRDGQDFAARLATFHDNTGILHGEARPDVAIDPFYLGVLMREAAFRHEVENVRSPI